jgi:hypothetical protein
MRGKLGSGWPRTEKASAKRDGRAEEAFGDHLEQSYLLQSQGRLIETVGEPTTRTLQSLCFSLQNASWKQRSVLESLK